ncbi:hypothetical protein DTU29_01930 [Salmonella enterica subsp. enterica serovar Minnesota]|nr:hypothetical protein [Salmonella enterica subsp. enterica serovar Minnesota]EEF0858887.1 hypothetical protein [Salmonella enterica subsp. enterica serovar Heidelberg]EAC0137429.1 hypothetical protein [Salmonella enterica subsp. enterica serovar Minnesota]EBX8692083.1 hypothetical protein [Salmonella enterica subsp. enterica serovar Minnesota]EBX9514163.1 hypothetical protein [Salmonella enterica subsp. enterica serovar Minnesota]
MQQVKFYTASPSDLSPPVQSESFCVDLVLASDYAELEAKYAALAADNDKAMESLKQGDAVVKLAHEKFSALAAENAGLKKFCKDAAFDADYEAELGMERGGFSDALNEIKTPATDAFLDEVRAQAFNDLCSAFVKDAKVVGLDDGDIVTVKEATDALLHCADQLRKGVHS